MGSLDSCTTLENAIVDVGSSPGDDQRNFGRGKSPFVRISVTQDRDDECADVTNAD